MSAFKDMLNADIKVFLNDKEFAEKRTLIYDGVSYCDIPIVLVELKQQDRKPSADDYMQGVYRVTATLYCDSADIDGVLPEKGQYIKINDEVNSTYYNEYRIVTSKCEMGMLTLELGAFDE